MRKELKKAIDQSRDVEGQIRSALQTPMKRNTLWIITESDYDREVYERFFNDGVVVKPSYDEKGKGSCDHVVKIVCNILKSKETKRIIGIREPTITTSCLIGLYIQTMCCIRMSGTLR